MKFNYQARTQEGQIQTGVIEASSREAAILLLQKYGLYVTFLEVTKISFYAKKIEILQRISRKDVVIFSRQLAIMLRSNVPLVESLHTLSNQTKNQNFKEKILKIAEKVEGGTLLSVSLSSYPKIFSPFYTNMVKSGEVSGKLSEVFVYLADHLEREYNFYSKVISAMIYPIFVFFVFLIILTLMAVFVVPQLSQVLGETGKELPQLTKMVIGLSSFLKRWWWVFILFLLGLGISAFKFLRTKDGKKIVDKLSLKLPLLGEFFKKIYLSRLAENLSTLISSGIPIVRALEITGEIVGNDTYKTIILKTLDGVKRGEPM
ncbi:type II secretion system F family protein, partial [Patescibacteria group bacterium]|nr:type II secretion system F family protein [Patescibacteria group bacterium]